MNDFLFFIRLLQSHRQGWLGALFLTLLTASSGLGLIALAGWFITASTLAGIAAPDGVAIAFNFMQPAVQIRLLAMTRTLSGYVERLVTHNLTFHYLAQLRVWFFRQLLTQNTHWAASYRSGEVLTVMSRHIDELDKLPLRLLLPSLSALALSGVSVIGLGQYSMALGALMGLLAVLLCFVLPLLIHYLNREHVFRFTTAYSAYKALQTEMLQGIQDLCIFQAYDRFANRLNDLAVKLAKNRYQSVNLNACWAAFNVLLTQAGLIVVVIAGSVWVLNETLDAAIYVMLVLFVLSLTEWLSAIGLGLGTLAEAQSAAMAVRSFVQAKSAIPVQPVFKTIPARGEIELQQISFAYPGRLPLFHDVSLKIGVGEKIALLGTNGEGKTTLLHLLSGLLDGYQGQVLYAGQSLTAYDRNAYIRHLGLLSQHSKIFTGTLQDNLKLAKPEADESELYQVLQQVELSYLANSGLGLKRGLGEGGLQLSTGEARRLALARVILKKPPILLLDEPTENLDRQTEFKLLSLIQEWAKDKTLILVTHKPAALSLVERVYQLQDGNISQTKTLKHQLFKT